MTDTPCKASDPMTGRGTHPKSDLNTLLPGMEGIPPVIENLVIPHKRKFPSSRLTHQRLIPPTE